MSKSKIEIKGAKTNAEQQTASVFREILNDPCDLFDWIKQENLSGNSVTIMRIMYVEGDV
jgi:hypothetical protein